VKVLGRHVADQEVRTDAEGLRFFHPTLNEDTLLRREE
jgi:hypothetical protein